MGSSTPPGGRVPDEAVRTARRRFLDGGPAPDDLVPAPILRSWRRCAELGLNDTGPLRVEPLSGAELRELVERNERIRRLCRPEVEALHVEGRSTGALAILTDADGLILDTLGHPEFADRAARVALRPGVPWGEATTGTNAVGTALFERRPITVQGSEHYFAPHRILSCSAAPILGATGDLLGVLDFSGPASEARTHALALVRLAVDQIEHRQFDTGFERAEIVRVHGDPALIGTPREGILVFEDDRLVAANRHGLALFGLDFAVLGRRRYGDLFAGRVRPGESVATLKLARGGEMVGRLESRMPSPVRSVPAARPSAPSAPVAPVVPVVRGAAAPIFQADAEAALARAVRLHDADVPVLIQGETGAGKEVFARAIHAGSQRAGRPFVAVNCAALPEGLIESELFGYEEGAFTGARRQGSKGLLRAADGGTLFLDEIGDMPLSLQARLLRVLQEREVVPLGGGQPVKVDFALLCATHRALGQRVEEGSFRADLYFRIAQYTVALRPLRELEDRAGLILTLWERLGGAANGVSLGPDTLTLLARYPWPGNFRQLVGLLRALMALADPGQPLLPEALPADIRASTSAVSREATPLAGLSVPPAPASAPPPVAASGPPPPGDLDAIAREAMRAALATEGGNVSRAAKRLGVSRSTLYRRLLSQSG
ncbi:sigma-54-dependent Fis family transcriptional regulator [Segnochrobactraceae bacterium EtOH-i3]